MPRRDAHAADVVHEPGAADGRHVGFVEAAGQAGASPRGRDAGRVPGQVGEIRSAKSAIAASARSIPAHLQLDPGLGLAVQDLVPGGGLCRARAAVASSATRAAISGSKAPPARRG